MSLSPKTFLSAFALIALTVSAQTVTPMAGAPLYFEAGQNQVNGMSQFIARGHDYQFLISPTEAQLVLRKLAATTTTGSFMRKQLTVTSKISTRTVRMQFVGANPQAQIQGDDELPGKVNYFVGNDSSQWRTSVPIFTKTRVEQIYSGVNLVYYGNQQRLEYDFTVLPKADPKQITIHFDGADKISIGAQGELVLKLGNDEIRQPAPVIYQTVGGLHKEINGGYVALDAQTVAFTVSRYDHNLPLVIDPILSYSTFLGGNGGDTGFAVKVDTNGFIYVAGQTLSTQLPVTSGAYQKNFGGGSLTGDAFVAKFNNNGSNLVYLTYLGGSADDGASDMAIDGAGNAYVAGFTDSSDFPATNAIFSHISGPYDAPAKNYHTDAFVAELNTNGSALVYSTFLGGNNNDAANGIAVDSTGNAYVTGYTMSTNFPTTNAAQSHLLGTQNTFVAKFAPGGTPLIYSTYLGGTNSDDGEGIAADAAGNAYVTGYTDSTNFPATNALQSFLNGMTNQTTTLPAYDAFVTKFNTNGSVGYSTFLGGTNSDFGLHIAADATGNVYVVGTSQSPNFPDTATNVNGLSTGITNNTSGVVFVYNAFLTKLDPTGTNLIYSALFGGTNIDSAEDVAVDPAGNAFVIGCTTSTNFPTFNTSGLLSPTNSGGTNVFVVAFNTNCSALLYSTYLGGSSADLGYGIAVDPLGNAYIVGQAGSANFPTVDAFQTTLSGTSDAFLAKILLTTPSPVLSITVTNNSGTNNFTVSWPAVLPFEPELGQLFNLEYNDDLTLTNNWQVIPSLQVPQVFTNGAYTYTFTSTFTNLFLRLHAQQ